MITGQGPPVNHRSSKSFNELGRFQPRELRKHSLLARSSTAQPVDGILNSVIRLAVGLGLPWSTYTEVDEFELAPVDPTEARKARVRRFGRSE
jgi:hypothetical protein